MKNLFNLESINQYMVFAIASIGIFLLVVVYAVWNYLKMKSFVNRALSSARISLEIVEVKCLYSKKKSALQKYPTLYNYVKGIDSLFEDYVVDFSKAKIVRYDRPKEEMRMFRDEYKQASKFIQELVQRYADLIKSIYRTKYPVRFLLNNFQINAKIYYTLFQIILSITVSRGLRLLSSFTFSQQRERFDYERSLQSITENSEIKIVEKMEMNCAA